MLARNARTRAASFALRDASDCAQIDWGSFGGVVVGNTRRRLSFFVMVLAYSRRLFVEFTVSQTMEHFLACHEHALAELGVPSKLMVDNLKSAVLQRLAGVAPVLIRAICTLPATTALRLSPAMLAAATRRGGSNPAWATSKRTSCGGWSWANSGRTGQGMSIGIARERTRQ
jgi:Integrase core domain